jgi:hypothetical protein
MNTNNERVGNITDYFVSDNADDGEEMTWVKWLCTVSVYCVVDRFPTERWNSWCVIDSRELFESTLKALDKRGIRESNLIRELNTMQHLIMKSIDAKAASIDKCKR